MDIIVYYKDIVVVEGGQLSFNHIYTYIVMKVYTYNATDGPSIYIYTHALHHQVNSR